MVEGGYNAGVSDTWQRVIALACVVFLGLGLIWPQLFVYWVIGTLAVMALCFICDRHPR